MNKFGSEYKRKWKRKHKERIKESNKRYRMNHPDYHKKYNNEHREQINKRNRKYREQHREQINKNARDNRRLHELGTSGGKPIKGLNKRPYSNYCEMCEKEQLRKLAYHHWNKSNPNIGIWVCLPCHFIVELIESGKIKRIKKKYFQLKKKVCHWKGEIR